MNPSIFKAYDIRGIYNQDWNDEDAYNIGHAIVKTLKPKTLAIGRDIRDSSKPLFDAISSGITDAGCSVVNLGITTTPMVYFASKQLQTDAAISLTASHNTKEWNGLKICKKNAMPVGENSGLKEIKEKALNSKQKKTTAPGRIENHDIKEEYYTHFAKYANFYDVQIKLAIDCANAMGIFELPLYEKFKNNLTIEKLHTDLKNPLGVHEANPLKTETLEELQEKVKETQSHLGIAYDGDADRVGFVDEKGNIIPMDLTTGLIAKILLEKNPGATILYDLRSSRAVKEIIEEKGGIAKECRVGHAFIKKQMRDENALFAGELSGHYYFRSNSNAECSTLAAIHLLNLMVQTKKPISELIKNLHRYHHSGEINSDVSDKEKIMETLKEKYNDGELSELDGIKISYSDWWFNVRPSNTEPVLRLNLEANTQVLMEEKKEELLNIIRQQNH